MCIILKYADYNFIDFFLSPGGFYKYRYMGIRNYSLRAQIYIIYKRIVTALVFFRSHLAYMEMKYWSSWGEMELALHAFVVALVCLLFFL